MIVNILDLVFNRKLFKENKLFGKVKLVCDTCSTKIRKPIYVSFIHLITNPFHTVFDSFGCCDSYYREYKHE